MALATQWLERNKPPRDPRKSAGRWTERPDRIHIESRAWSDTREFLKLMTEASDEGLDQAARAEIAADILAHADDMDGPMPADIREFVERNRPG